MLFQNLRIATKFWLWAVVVILGIATFTVVTLNRSTALQVRLLAQAKEPSVDAGSMAASPMPPQSSGPLLGFLALWLLAIGLGGRSLVRTIQIPIAQANALAQRVGEGDLTTRFDVARRDEFGDLLRSLAAMNDSLVHMVRQVEQTAQTIAIASDEIAKGNDDFARRTGQAGANLKTTAASLDALTSTVLDNAENASKASALASDAFAVASKGGAAVAQVVVTMNAINSSSKKISDIIGVIDGIAFQTNILALNAAVEAARAGELGKGFAVVASEVRILAQRSAKASKEIKSLIDRSATTVQAGAKYVAEAGDTMTSIVTAIRQTAEIIEAIATASVSQSNGIGDMNQAIGNLDQMTQQNASLIQESEASAQRLRDQSSQLVRMFSMFKIHGIAR